MQILLDIISSSKILPVEFVKDLLNFTLNKNNEKMLEQLLIILSKNSNYQSILKSKTNQIIDEMKSNEDSLNIRLLEKNILLFSYNPSNNLSPIIDRLINLSSHSSISYSSLDTRYIIAMIILNSLTSFDKYLKYLQQIWKSVIREKNGIKQVVIAYAKQWEYVLKMNANIDDIHALVKCLDDQYELISKILQSIDQNQFQQWIENIIQYIVCYLKFLFRNICFFLLIENSIRRC
jgi:hypothetical protein